MKYNLDGVIVVEGKSDVSYLSSFINASYFTTNGLDISEDKLLFLERASKKNTLYILTDDDEAGEKIRNTIKNRINGVIDVKIPKNSRKFLKKQGVAESDKEVVISALKPYFTKEGPRRIDYDLTSLISLDESPREVKDKIIKECGLLEGNNKSLENQLNILKISKEELWK